MDNRIRPPTDPDTRPERLSRPARRIAAISVYPNRSACSSAVTPSRSPIEASAPASSRIRTISWCRAPPSPSTTASSNAVHPSEFTWFTSIPVDTTRRTYSTCPRSLAGITDTPPNRFTRPRSGDAGNSTSSISTLPVTPVTNHALSCWSSSASGSAPSATSTRAASTWSPADASNSGVRPNRSRASSRAPSRTASATASASPDAAAASSAASGSVTGDGHPRRSARVPVCGNRVRAPSPTGSTPPSPRASPARPHRPRAPAPSRPHRRRRPRTTPPRAPPGSRSG